MMNLIIDIGNTAAKLAVFQRDKIIEVQSVTTKKLISEVEKIIDTYHGIEKGILSSVVLLAPSEINSLQNLLPLKVLESSFRMPFKN